MTRAQSQFIEEIDFDGSGQGTGPLEIECDMTTNGGGWTAVTPEIADVHFNSKVSTIEFITNFGKDAEVCAASTRGRSG